MERLIARGGFRVVEGGGGWSINSRASLKKNNDK